MKQIIAYTAFMIFLTIGISYAGEIDDGTKLDTKEKVLQGDVKEGADESPQGEKKESIFSYVQKVKGPDERLWEFKAGGIYLLKEGNTDSLEWNAKAEFEFDNETLEVGIGFKYFYKKENGDLTERNWSGEVNLGYYLLQRLELTAFNLSEHDKKALLYYRNYTGFGPKIIFFKNYFWKIDITGAPTNLYEKYYGFEYYRFGWERHWYWTSRFHARITPIEIIRLTYAFFHSFDMNNTSDYKYYHDVSAGITVVKHFELSAGYIYKFNNDPPPVGLVKKTDSFTYVTVSLTL